MQSETTVTELIKMEEKENNSQLQRRFGYAHIVWHIKYYFFVTRDEAFEINSPEFSVDGFCSTKWRFIMKGSKSKENDPIYSSVKIVLENLESNEVHDNVRISWNMWYEDLSKKRITLCDVENAYADPENSIEETINDSSFQNILKHNASNILKIDGYFLVRSAKDTLLYKRAQDKGLWDLSQDMNTLFSIPKKEDRDMHVRVGKHVLPCNKAILSARSPALKDIFAEHEDPKIFAYEFHQQQNLNAMKSVLHYLYSGSLERVLRFPSVSIGKAIEFFRVRELEIYYPKDEITLETTFGAKKFHFKWTVIEINARNYIFLSPDFTNETLKATFRLHLDMNRTSESPNLDLRLEFVHGVQPQELDVKFEVITPFGLPIHQAVMRWTRQNDRIKNFLHKSSLSDPYFVEAGNLIILLSIYIPDETITESADTSLCLHTDINYEQIYQLLSSRLESLFESKEYSDFTIICKGEKIEVHKFIIAARCYVLRPVVKNRSKLLMNGFDPKILRFVIFYMYTGRLNASQQVDVMQVYLAAKKLSIEILRNLCCEKLSENHKIENALETLFFAVDNQISTLKRLAIVLIKNNINTIRKQESWEILRTRYSEVYEELRSSENISRQNYPEHINFADIELYI